MSFRKPSVLPGFGLTFGFTTCFLSTIVLLPLAALVLSAASMHWSDFVRVVSSPRALGSYRLSFGASLLAATINVVFGFIIAWTLARYEFPGRKIIDALIDMPFALPTAVSGIALTTVFAQNGWIGRYLEPLGVKVAYTWLGVTLALTLISMPFAVRAVGEYGSVIFIAGNLPMKTEITPLLIVIHLEEFDYQGAAALGVVMLGISFVILLAINLLQAWGRRRHVRAAH